MSRLKDLYNDEIIKAMTDKFGYKNIMEVPKLDISIPLYHGTSDSVLQHAIGHLEWSSLPTGGESTHCVVSGHRGLPSTKLFTELDKLREECAEWTTQDEDVLSYAQFGQVAVKYFEGRHKKPFDENVPNTTIQINYR